MVGWEVCIWLQGQKFAGISSGGAPLHATPDPFLIAVFLRDLQCLTIPPSDFFFLLASSAAYLQSKWRKTLFRSSIKHERFHNDSDNAYFFIVKYSRWSTELQFEFNRLNFYKMSF